MRKERQLRLKSGKNALVIAAHPDDEVIWAGASIMRHKRVNWTCFSLCRGSDADREPKFRKVMEFIGAEGIIKDVEDEDIMGIIESVLVFKENILAEISGIEYDYIFSHGENGEYGHKRHIGLHRAVKELFLEKKLSPEKLFFFNYKKLERKTLPMAPAAGSDYILELKQSEFREKKRIMAELYGYPYGGIDVNLCPRTEAFLEYKINKV